MPLETVVAGIRLEHPIMNAAGTCRTMEDVRELCRTPVAAVMVGSITKEARPGNSGQTFWPGMQLSVNSLGVPNGGLSYYEGALPEMARIVHDHGIPLVVSVLGFVPREYADLTEFAYDSGADLVELNFGCPNIWQAGAQKQIPSFSTNMIAEILNVVEEKIGDMGKVAVKLSPFMDENKLANSAAMLARFPIVRVVTSCNTLPNVCRYGDDGMPLINAKDTEGYSIISGGLSGPELKQTSLPQVRTLRHILHQGIQIIGVGGITSGQDIKDYLAAGATAVQIGTHVLNRGPGVFSELLGQYTDLVGSQDESTGIVPR